MRVVAVVFLLVGASFAFPQQKQEEVTIVRSENENKGDGTYSFAWETSDGSKHEERGFLKPNPDPKGEPFQTAQGAFQFYAPEGDLYQVQYLADENGFQPEGKHLPTPPPIPAEIQKALDIIANNVKNAPPQAHAAAKRYN